MKIAKNKEGEYIDILDSLPNEEYFCVNCNKNIIRNFGSKKKFFSHQHDHSYDCELKVAKIEKELSNITSNKKINNLHFVEEVLDLDYDENNPLLKGLNKQQIQAVLHKDHPCLVISSAGSGKTKVLTHRIAYLIQQGVFPENILAITFSKKAAEEMKSRLYKLDENIQNVNVGTFHSICYSMIREQNYISNTKVIKNWQQTKFLEEVIKQNKLKINWDYKSFLNFISLQKNNMITPDDELLIPENIEFLRDDLETIYFEYEKLKDNEHLIDFDDMLLKCYTMLKENSNIREYYQNQFKYILVDEFNDTNNIQFELLKLLLNKDENLFVVGDDKQEIYEFRFANISIMLDFQKVFPTTKIIKLNINYRSTRNIVELSNKLISHNKNQLDNVSKSNIGYCKPIEINDYYDEDKEGDKIAKKIQELHNQGYKYKDIAILYRCNAQSRAIEDAFIVNKIPYIIISGINFLQRKEIADIIAYLKVIQNHSNDTAIKRIINIPNRYLGNAFINQISNYAEYNNKSIFDSLIDPKAIQGKKYWENNAYNLYNTIDDLSCDINISPEKLIENVISKIKYIDYLMKLNDDSNIEDRIDNIETFKTIASKFTNLDELLEYVDKTISESNKNNSKLDKVKMMTIHKSKGMEFPVVFLVGVNKDLLPHKKAENIEEERRICYVGVSRAMKELYISYTKMYNRNKVGKSIFISNMK